MPSILALAFVLPAFHVAEGTRGRRLTTRGIRAINDRGVHVALEHHNATQRYPRTPDFFTTDAEQMDEVPNLEDAAYDDGHSCHPKCWWECDIPKCNTACKIGACQPPKCVTTCEKQDMTAAGCSRLCEDPQCAVVCPDKSCLKGGCPECKTICNKPKCSLSCGRICHSQCADPVCKWDCGVGSDCVRKGPPVCKMKCEKPTCTGFKGKNHNLVDIYHGFGDPTQEQPALYGVRENVRTDMATVPAEQLQGLGKSTPMQGPLAAVPPLQMESAKPMAPPIEYKPAEGKKPWKAGAGLPPKKPCKEEEAYVAPSVTWVLEPTVPPKHGRHEIDPSA